MNDLRPYRLMFITLIIAGLFFSTRTYAQNVKTYIPPKAFEHKDLIKKELDKHFPSMPDYNYFPALGEQESCISLKHSKCWTTFSELKTSREQGVGIFQITRAWSKDGNLRFDTLKDLRDKYKSDLSEMSWDNIKTRPDLQVRSAILLLRDNYVSLYAIEDKMVRLQMTDSAYNGGLRDVQKSRRACGLSSNCDPQIWFDNVEKYSVKSDKPLYGNRSAKFINNEHVYYIFKIRIDKYRKHYFTDKDFVTAPVKPHVPVHIPTSVPISTPIPTKEPTSTQTPVPTITATQAPTSKPTTVPTASVTIVDTLDTAKMPDCNLFCKIRRFFNA